MTLASFMCLATSMVFTTISVRGVAVAQTSPPDTSGSATALQQSRAATRDLLLSLRRTLESQLAAGGPVHAVSVCADTAQVLSAFIAKKNGLQIRRVSDRWRNPLDEPDAFERSVLKRFADALRETTLTDTTEYSEVAIDKGGRVFRYMKPIRIQGMCATCHGEPAHMDPAVREIIRSRYPDDRATGYALGNLRGAVSARVPLPAPRDR